METNGRNTSAIFARKLYRSDPVFAAWLANYVAEYGGGSWTGRKHEFWAVDMSHVNDGAHVHLFPGRDCCYLARVMDEDTGVLSVAPVPHWAVAKAQSAVRKSLTFAVLNVVLPLSDVVFKWGQKTCPQCFSRQLIPFTFESDDEAPHHQCIGCNTIWPPRAARQQTPTCEAVA